jgi:cytidine deaminase
MPRTQIALLGGPGAGKDTFVRLFRKLHPNISCQVIRLAEPLYKIQKEVYKVCFREIKEGQQDGVLLNFLGKHMREIHPQVLIDHFANTVRESKADLILCSDARPLDIPFIKKMGFTVIHIATDPSLALERRRKRGDLSLGNSHHETELGISADLYDIQIPNQGSLEDFEKAILRVFQESDDAKEVPKI